MNLTSHVLMRYLQRDMNKDKVYIINDTTFKTWRRVNEDKIIEATKEINEIISDITNIIVEATFNGKEDKYIINKTHNWIFVTREQNAITCYKFVMKNLTEESSVLIREIMLNELKSKTDKFNSINNRNNEIISKNNLEITELEDKIKSITAELELLKSEKKRVETENETVSKEIVLEKTELNGLIRKIVNPSKF